jgi:aspartate-semialdehyde dehydrogenase
LAEVLPITSRTTRPRVAIVGGDTLLAKEIRDLLESFTPRPTIELISAAADESTVLATDEEDALVLAPLNQETLTGVKVLFLAGSPASSRRALKANPPDGAVLIDLTAALEDHPAARLRAPMAEQSALSPEARNRSGIHVIANSAATAIAMVLGITGRRATIVRSLAHVFEPASERGKKGLDELQQQTVAVLSFKKLKQDVFDAQLAFNLLARFGEEALEPLEEVGARVERHLASLLAAQKISEGPLPMPSLRVIQAPVFHGHSISLWLELESDPEPAVIAEWLSNAGIDVRPDEPPANANIAGQNGLSAGAIARDANHPRGYWMWLVADTFRLAAENAVAVARELL